MALAVFALSACEKDEEDTPTPQKETQDSIDLAGVYTGWTKADAAYFKNMVGTDVDQMTITANDDASFKVVFVSNTWGTATFDSVSVAKGSDAYSFVSSGSVSMASHGGEAKEYDCTLDGSVSLNKQSFTVVVDIPSVMGGTKLTFQNGAAPVEMVLAGSYSGWTQADAAYFKAMVNNEVDKVVITDNDDATIKVVYTSGTWGTATFESVSVTEGNEGYVMESEGTVSMASHGGDAKDYDCVMKATISKDKSTYVFSFDIPSVMGGTQLTFQNGKAPLSLVLAGSYKGWSNASCTYFQNRASDGDTIVMTANADGTVNISYASATWGNGTFANVALSSTDDGYALAEAEGSIAMSGMGGQVSSYDAILKGSISSDKRSYTFEISVPAVMGGLSIEVKQGTAPQQGVE